MPTDETARGHGARYGPKVRGKYEQVERKQRSTYKCPYCKYEKVKRKATGIWHCRKCDTTFTNKAFEVGELDPIKKVIESEVEEGEQ